MDNIAQRLKTYIDTHPIDLGDSDCETVLDQLYQAYAESHESDPRRSATVLRNWKSSSAPSRWMTTTPSLTFAVACAALMSERLLSMA